MANKDTVKPWFETGDYPTQAQFWQTFDWLRWKDESLAITDVAGLQAFINNMATIASIKAQYIDQFTLNADGSYAMPLGTIVTGIIVDTATDFNLTIGKTVGGNEIADTLPISAAGPESVTIMIEAIRAARTIYLSGITSATKFIIIKTSI